MSLLTQLDHALQQQLYLPVDLTSLPVGGTITLGLGAEDPALAPRTSDPNWLQIARQLGLLTQTNPQGGCKGIYLRRDTYDLEVLVVHWWAGQLQYDFFSRQFDSVWSTIQSLGRLLGQFKFSETSKGQVNAVSTHFADQLKAISGALPGNPVSLGLSALQAALDHSYGKAPTGIYLCIAEQGVERRLADALSNQFSHPFMVGAAGHLVSPTASALVWDTSAHQMLGRTQVFSLDAQRLLRDAGPSAPAPFELNLPDFWKK